jgi:hypothetical protein
MNRYVPGPWEAEMRYGETDECGAPEPPYLTGRVGYYDEDDGEFCAIVEGVMWTDADVRLVAAAPNLLESLRELYGILDRSPLALTCVSELCRAKDALDAATGGAS